MPNINYLRSVSPLANVGAVAAESGQLFGGLGSVGRGPLSAKQRKEILKKGTKPTKYRPPTQVYEKSIFGNQFRDVTPEDRVEYNKKWLKDKRNRGHGAGQVDPKLARAAMRGKGGK